MTSIHVFREANLPWITSLIWTADGELSAEDRLMLLRRLQRPDPCRASG
jgi:hypothetical protein